MTRFRVNARRGDEGSRVADWDDAVWLSFDPAAALVLQQQQHHSYQQQYQRHGKRNH